MPLTPETLPRHELVGLRVEVVDASNPDVVGISGRVVRETTRTLDVEGPVEGVRSGEAGDASEPSSGPDPRAAAAEQSRVWTVPKTGTTFEFELTDEAAADREAAGTASEPSSETAGATVTGDQSSSAADAGQSGDRPERRSGTVRAPEESDGGEGVAYVTVDGARLLSRPARRTETGGRPKWR